MQQGGALGTSLCKLFFLFIAEIPHETINVTILFFCLTVRDVYVSFSLLRVYGLGDNNHLLYLLGYFCGPSRNTRNAVNVVIERILQYAIQCNDTVHLAFFGIFDSYDISC